MDRAYENQWNNTFIVTGDTHAFWTLENNKASVLQGSKDPSTTLNSLDPNKGYQRGQLVEFGGSAVSSNGWGAKWLNADNATASAQNMTNAAGSLLYSEGFCELF